MHLLTIQIQQLAQPLVCRFKAGEDAKREYATLTTALGPTIEGVDDSGFIKITDDYGHDVAFWTHHITHLGLIDLDKDLIAQAEIAVLQARGQARANQAVQSDPMARFISGAGQNMAS
jgi:hypothetical protein